MKLNSLDKSHDKVLNKSLSAANDSTKTLNKCTVQEGVRMMVAPSMFVTGKKLNTLQYFYQV